jgi:hypothetical protein
MPATLSPQRDRQGTIFDLAAIEASLRAVAAHLAYTDQHVDSPSERLDCRAVDCMISGYAFIDELIQNKIDMFLIGQSSLFLEVNALVLFGCDTQMRMDFAEQLAATEKKFYDDENGGIRDVVEWYALHATDSAWLRAAGVYIRILSEPELFIEGNHRTGALVISYILARSGYPPFVLTVNNVEDFREWSELFASRCKNSILLRCQMPWLKRRFAEFLRAEANPKFLRTFSQ